MKKPAFRGQATKGPTDTVGFGSHKSTIANFANGAYRFSVLTVELGVRINIRQGFRRVNILIQIVFVFGCVSYAISQWNFLWNPFDEYWNESYSGSLTSTISWPGFDASAKSSRTGLCSFFAGKDIYSTEECHKLLVVNSYILKRKGLLSDQEIDEFRSAAYKDAAEKVKRARYTMLEEVITFLLIGFIVLRLFAFTVAWLWKGFTDQSNSTASKT